MVTMTVTGVNDAPLAAQSIATITATTGQAFTATLSAGLFTDVDQGDVVAVNVRQANGSALPTWLTWNPVQYTLAGMAPAGTASGTIALAAIGSDLAGASASIAFGLTVTAGSTGGGDDDHDDDDGHPDKDKDGKDKNKNKTNDIITGTAAGDTINSGAGNDVVQSGAGNDQVKAGSGNDIVQSGSGNDTVSGGSGNNLLDGGTGIDRLTTGDGNSLIAGGKGNDILNLGDGNNVVGFNRGDGQDAVNVDDDAGWNPAGNVLSLGGGIKLADLSLSRNGTDLTLNTGNGDAITFKDWYDGKRSSQSNQAFAKLQLIQDAASDFNAASNDPLRNKRVETFDFRGIVTAFDAQRALNPGLSNWALSAALLNFHLSGSNSAALGGDLAYQYGNRGSFAGIGIQSAFDNLAAQGFGVTAQTLKPFTGLQEGLVKLV